MRHLALGGLLVLATATAALGNGRPPSTSTINFRQGNEQHIAAGMTFGLVVSTDGGATWRWMCEDAIKYGGNYDPDYAYSATGALFATTFDGSMVNRDGCTFDATTFGSKFVSAITLGPDNALYMATAQAANAAAVPPDPGDSNIYRSTDNGVSFPTSSMPGQVGDWWNSLEVAPTEPTRVYLSGYRLNNGLRSFLLFRSDDSGASWTPMSMTGLTTTRNSSIDIVGISKLDPDLIYARVTHQNENAISDGLFRSTDAGASWTPILTRQDELAFVVRANGDLVAGTRSSGTVVSRAPSNGAAWEDLVDPPHINCLVENTAGEVWACTQNFGGNQVPSDEAGIMKSTDLVTWTRVLRFQDVLGPVPCPAGTIQADTCAAENNWCILRRQLGIEADPTSCPELADMSPGDATIVKPPKGCCDSSVAGGGTAWLAIGAVVGMVILRRRRRARSC